MNILLLMMGGSGTRFGASIPKQFTIVEGAPVFSYIMKKYDEMDEIDKMVIVCHKDWKEYVHEWEDKLEVKKLAAVVDGGDTRSGSVLNGLLAAKKFAEDDAVVLLHDATHPYVDIEGTKGVIEGVKKYGGATLGQCQYDTCYLMDDEKMIKEVVPRTNVVSGASPEAFFFGKLYDIYTKSSPEELEKMTSAGAMALAHGIKMQVIPANVLNLKITYPGDMELFKKLCKGYFF